MTRLLVEPGEENEIERGAIVIVMSLCGSRHAGKEAAVYAPAGLDKATISEDLPLH
ncbi:hypothetical protein HBDW_05350 [Herbaspirillum sp. DW155]|uniref:hypothetical protein n=1 Tax=Herbaspirillum sp. DW155 TaxID=3095609 RepID=UPI003085CB66|nr:hypothetical protein HBDW_05350 [Herbaspirillum sp. DW155]